MEYSRASRLLTAQLSDRPPVECHRELPTVRIRRGSPVQTTVKTYRPPRMLYRGSLSPDVWILYLLSERATTAQQAHDEEHEGDDQQHMDERADGVGADDSEQPRNQQNYGYGVQHRDRPFLASSSHVQQQGRSRFTTPLPTSMLQTWTLSVHLRTRASPPDLLIQ